MGIFSRRAIQQMIDENSEFLTEQQIDNQVAKLNKNNFQSIDTLWEVTILNVFSKLGEVVHEPNLEGSSKLDLMFTCKDGTTFIADITSVSDEGFEQKFSVKAFDVELRDRLKKAGLLFKGWDLRVGCYPVVKYKDKKIPKLPPRSEFAKEIFNSQFKNFLKQVKENPDQSHTYRVSTEKTEMTLTYLNTENYSISQMPIYDTFYQKDKNPVYNALRKKADQLKKVNYKGFRGIIVCDGGCNMINREPSNSFEPENSAVDASLEFLRQNKSIDFILIIASKQSKLAGRYILPGEKWREIDVTIITNKSISTIPTELKKVLEGLEKHFPEPINNANGIRESIRHGYKPKTLQSLSGGISFSNNHISISATSILALLAGKITQEELFESLGFKPWSKKYAATRNIFEYMIDNKSRLVDVELEEKMFDDSYLTFRFAGKDAAISNFINPKSSKTFK